MVIFHSYVNVYQRVYHIYVFQIVLYYILHELLTDYHHESTCVCPPFFGRPPFLRSSHLLLPLLFSKGGLGQLQLLTVYHVFAGIPQFTLWLCQNSY